MTYARLYRPSDEPELVRLAAAPMPGWARLRYDTASGYAAVEALKGDSEIVVVEDADGHVAGCGTRSTTLRYLDGVPARIGYLGGLRSFPGPRGGFGFFRGFRFLTEIERANPNALTVTTILDGNAQGRALLTSGRAGIPAYCPRAGIVTYALAPYGRALAPRAPQQFDEFLSFYAREAPRKQLFPVLDDKLPQGLSPEDFLCIRRSGRIVAAGAVWHHGMRRRIFIDGYGRAFSLVRPLAGVVSRLVGLPVPPPPGGEFRCAYLAYALAENDEPALFGELVEAARSLTGGANLVLSLHADDPLASSMRRTRAWRFGSNLYTVSFDGGRSEFAGVPYVEAGAL